MADAIFTDGLIAKKPHEKAPDFVKASLSFKVEEFTKFLNEHSKNGWVNVQVKEARSGKYYAELDTYEKKPDPSTGEVDPSEVPPDTRTSVGVNGEIINTDDIPF